ncbi:hypothetical protein E2P81_ATG05961 [Venturia nashicola]|uniref:Protein kinase domain-containing protein n=1 Tax=Venturia nashicola TaxID=86259 RepID=A0A4Z1P469_9PEZI|nr:hypothetical protein E6O75_ATG06106 [Venturia nashicola]TLD29667.1 hypothetical protein E2P81_ATG05961 [Venturia nashicola]
MPLRIPSQLLDIPPTTPSPFLNSTSLLSLQNGNICTNTSSVIRHPLPWFLDNHIYDFLPHLSPLLLRIHLRIVSPSPSRFCVTMFRMILRSQFVKCGAELPNIEGRVDTEKNGSCLPSGSKYSGNHDIGSALVFIHCRIHFNLQTGTYNQPISTKDNKPWNKISHRDIKPDNISLRWRDKADATTLFPDLVLGDFGNAIIKHPFQSKLDMAEEGFSEAVTLIVEFVNYVTKVVSIAPLDDHIVSWAFDGEDLATHDNPKVQFNGST